MPPKPYLIRALFPIALLISVALPAACGTAPQIYSKVSHQSIALQAGDLEAHGLAFITPSTVTGQEEEKQAVALTFAEVLIRNRPDIRCLPLAQTLSAVNRAGFAEEYQRMFSEYRDTGIFDRDTLRKISDVTGAQYLAQLKLQGFSQGATERLGAFGLRIMETKFATLRLFFQIWNAAEGAIVWEGIQELNYSVESIDERTVTLQTVIEKAAENLVGRLPAPAA